MTFILGIASLFVFGIFELLNCESIDVDLSSGLYKAADSLSSTDDSIIIATTDSIILATYSNGVFSETKTSFVTEVSETIAFLRNNLILSLVYKQTITPSFIVYNLDLEVVSGPINLPIDESSLLNLRIYQPSYVKDNEVIISGKKLYLASISSDKHLSMTEEGSLTSKVTCATPFDFATNEDPNGLIFASCTGEKLYSLNASTFEKIQEIDFSNADASVKSSTFGFDLNLFITAKLNRVFKFGYFSYNQKTLLVNDITHTVYQFRGFRNIDRSNFCFAEAWDTIAFNSKLVLMSSPDSSKLVISSSADPVLHSSSASFASSFPLVNLPSRRAFLFTSSSRTFSITTFPSGWYECAGKISATEFRCLYCSGGGPTDCQVCRADYLLKNGECSKICPDGFSAVEKDTCVECGLACELCNSELCLQCKNSYTIDPTDNKSCVKDCEDRMYLINRDECGVCLPYCISCSSDQDCIEYERVPLDVKAEANSKRIFAISDVEIKISFFLDNQPFSVENFNDPIEAMIGLFEITLEKTIQGSELMQSEELFIAYQKDRSSGDMIMMVNFTSYQSEGIYELKMFSQRIFIQTTPSKIPMINKTLLVQVEKRESVSPSVLQNTKSISEGVNQFSSIMDGVSSVMATTGILLAVDPTGLVLKFIMVIQLIGKLQFINIFFGDITEIVLQGIMSSNKADSAERRDEIRLEEDGFKGKFSIMVVETRLSSKIQIYCYIYTITWVLRILGEIKLYFCKKEMKVTKRFYWMYLIVKRVNFALYCLLLNDFIFFSTRLLSHTLTTSSTFSSKFLHYIWYSLIVLDSFTIFTIHAALRQSNSKERMESILFDMEILKKAEIRKQSRHKKHKDQEFNYQGDIKGICGSRRTLRKKDGELNELKLNKDISKRERFRAERLFEQFHQNRKSLSKKSNNRNEESIDERNARRREILQAKIYLLKLKDNDAIRNFVLAGLDRDKPNVFSSLVSKLTNYLFLIRTPLIEICLVGLSNLPQAQIISLLIVDLSMLILVLSAFFTSSQFRTCWHMVALSLRSTFFVMFLGQCFRLSSNYDNTPVTLNEQLFTLLLIFLMIILEYILVGFGAFFAAKKSYLFIRNAISKKKIAAKLIDKEVAKEKTARMEENPEISIRIEPAISSEKHELKKHHYKRQRLEDRIIKSPVASEEKKRSIDMSSKKLIQGLNLILNKKESTEDRPFIRMRSKNGVPISVLSSTPKNSNIRNK